MPFQLRLLATFAALSLAAGCSDSEDTDDVTDTGTTDVTADASDTDMTDTAADADPTDTGTDAETDAVVEVFPDTTFRLVGVNIIRPAGVGPILGNLITSDINTDKLHVLIQFSNFAGAWPTTFDITGNAGQLAEGGYTWFDGVTIDTAVGTIDAEGFFQSDDTLDIIFPALEPGATEPLQIPVSDLNLEGELFQDGDAWVIEGTLSGAILAANITDVTVDLGSPRLLSDLLGGDEAKDYPVGATGDALTGWRLEAEITAENVTFVDPM